MGTMYRFPGEQIAWNETILNVDTYFEIAYLK